MPCLFSRAKYLMWIVPIIPFLSVLYNSLTRMSKMSYGIQPICCNNHVFDIQIPCYDIHVYTYSYLMTVWHSCIHVIQCLCIYVPRHVSHAQVIMSCSCLFPVLMSFMPTNSLPNPMYSNHVIIQPIIMCSGQLSIHVSHTQDSVIKIMLHHTY